MIRRANLDDVSAIRTSILAAYAPVAARGISLPDVAGGVADDIRDNLVWIVEQDTRAMAGLIAASVNGALHVMNLFVHPDAQGQGLARRLLSLAETYARTQGLMEMRLATHREMPENIALYRHLGWHEDSREGDKVVMIKPLGE